MLLYQTSHTRNKRAAFDMTSVYMTEGTRRSQKFPEFTDSYEVIYGEGSVTWSDGLDML